MNIKRISASAIGVFLECPYKFKLKYHDKEKELEPPNPWGPAGTAVHSTLERWFTENPDAKGFMFSKLLEIFAEECGNQGLDATVYNEWIGHFNHWVKRFNYPKKVIALEKKIEMTLPNGIPIISYLDMIEEVDENTIRVHDWKSGRAYSDDDLEENLQAPIYIIGAKQLYPDKKIEFVFDFLKFNEMPYIYTSAQMRNIIKYIKGIYESMKSMSPEDAQPRLGGGCMFCGFHDRCGLLDNARAGKLNVAGEISSGMDDLICAHVNISGALKALDIEKKRLTELIKTKMNTRGIEEFQSEAASIKTTQNHYVKYNPQTVYDIFSKHGLQSEVINVSKQKIDKLMDILSNEEQMEIEDSAGHSYSSSSLRITQKRNKNGKRKETSRNAEFY